LRELLRRPVADRIVVVVATERADGDVHATDVAPDVLVARQLAVSGRRWVMLDEVHGTGVRWCTAADVATATAPVAGPGDVLVGSGDPALAVWVGDCAPVVMVRDDGALVACHAGWRGLAAGILDVAVDALGAPPVAAVVGPCIGPCCYEFGADDLAAVAAGVGVEPASITATTRAGTLALDVPAAVTAGLAVHGAVAEVAGSCTCCDDRWFSHRRGDRGRHAVVAWTEAP
jgi:copper oxidase (laccase) domain-containing protein